MNKSLNQLLVVLCLALVVVVAAVLISDGKDRNDGNADTSSSGEFAPPVSTGTSSAVPSGEPVRTSLPQPATPEPVVEQWKHPKEWYRNVCNQARQSVHAYLNGPYTCDRSLASQVLAQANAIEQGIDSLSPDAVEARCRQLGHDYKRFKEGCRWRPGVRHPQYAHVVSAVQPDSWSAEAGWEFVNPGTADLTVRKVLVQRRCPSCRGSGQFVSWNRCPGCGGRGRVDNPAAAATQAVANMAGLFGNKARRRPIPSGPRSMPCSNCQGRGRIQVRQSCGSCSGSGQVLR